jgi:hypothetical protein
VRCILLPRNREGERNMDRFTSRRSGLAFALFFAGIVTVTNAVAQSPSAPPAPPALVAADPFACPLAEIGWSFVPGATFYELWASQLSSFAGAARLYAGPETSFRLSMGVGNVLYFKAKACNANGCSELSSATARVQGARICP